MNVEHVFWPAEVELLKWALVKLAEHDFHFSTEGRPDGKWTLTMSQHDEEGTPSEFELTEEQRHMFDAVTALASASGKTREQILDEIDSGDFGWHFNLGQYLKENRLKLGDRAHAEVEESAEKAMPAAFSDGIAMAVMRDISRVFPKMVRRFETLRSLPCDTQVPDDVQWYLREATECYIYGRFIACLVVCRSAIEFALRERLGNPAGDLASLIGMAREQLPYTHGPILKFADEVRQKANPAVHQAAPSPEVCKEMFYKTRSVLRELYTVQDRLGPLGAGAGG